MATNTVTGNPVINAINATASDARVRLAMLMGTKLESGWNAGSIGDNGHSIGAFQINLPAHPNVSAASASDPQFAARFMLPAYQAGVNRVDPALWNSDPALAAATAAFYAERPAVMYPTTRVRASWNDVSTAWNGGTGAIGSGLGLGGGGDVNTLTGAIPNPINAVGNGVSELAKWAGWQIWDGLGGLADKIYFGILIGGGAITIAVGFYLMMKHSSAGDVASQTTSAYGSVLGGLMRPTRAITKRGVRNGE